MVTKSFVNQKTEVLVDEIDLENPFVCLRPFSMQRLDHFDLSFDSFGVLVPVLLFKENDRLMVVDGFKRVSYCFKNNITSVSAIVFEDIQSLYSCLSIFHPFYFQSPPIQALLLSVGFTFSLSRSDLKQTAVTLFDASIQDQLLQDYLKISSLREEYLLFIFRKQWSLKQCRSLLVYPSCILDLFSSSLDSFSASNLRICLDLAFDLYRNDESILDLLDKKFFSQKDFSVESLTSFLWSQKYPRLSLAQRPLKRLQKSLLNQGLHIGFDETLEKKEFILRHSFQSFEDIDDFLSFFDQNRPKMKEFLKFL